MSAFVREEKIGSKLQKLLISSTIMQAIVANVENVHFEVEMQINMQLGTLPLPFSGMDSKSGSQAQNVYFGPIRV